MKHITTILIALALLATLLTTSAQAKPDKPVSRCLFVADTTEGVAAGVVEGYLDIFADGSWDLYLDGELVTFSDWDGCE